MIDMNKAWDEFAATLPAPVQQTIREVRAAGSRSFTFEAFSYAWERMRREADAKQAQIDALMLEYCPDEMTPEQLEEWGRHQTPVDPDEEAAIRKTIGGI